MVAAGFAGRWTACLFPVSLGYHCERRVFVAACDDQERIVHHRKQHDEVLATIPQSVNVGAFAVNLAEVRSVLVKKHTVRNRTT